MIAERPNHIWGIDITYIRLAHGWLYLPAVLDWYSRYILSWALSQTLEMDFVLAAVDTALLQATPEIWNSDQGSHFTVPSIWSVCKTQTSRSVWMAAGAPATTSSPNDYGAPSNTKKSIS